MVHAFVLVEADVGLAADLVETIVDVDVVSEGHVVAGEWDLVVELEAAEVYDVLNAIADEVQSIDGVANTKTYVALED